MQATLEGAMRECALRRENITRRKMVLDEEIKEAEALLGILMKKMDLHGAHENTQEEIASRETLHRKVERIKIKLEDVGASSGAEILKEYDDTQTRDAFLARELADLESSITSLRVLIAELRDTIERTFKGGIEKINTQFSEFFKQMFGGGSAFLSIIVEHRRVRDDESDAEEDDSLPLEHGIEINVTLPHKKVKDLNMLSGGERSLVSIALLFAMSQVNPPPFLVLDETDAALDEANSRRYGDMLDMLSKHSKLIVVTHNRETMSRAQVLYGVTMSLDGASKLLSIKFDEAVQIAK
jgi:chromosome segregation protein